MLSEAPAVMNGTTATSGHMPFTTLSTAPRSFGVGEDSGLGVAAVSVVTATDGSPMAATRAAWTSAADSPGIARHWMVARARCGSAASACPPWI